MTATAWARRAGLALIVPALAVVVAALLAGIAGAIELSPLLSPN